MSHSIFKETPTSNTHSKFVEFPLPSDRQELGIFHFLYLFVTGQVDSAPESMIFICMLLPI